MIVTGIYCYHCKKFIYSRARHDMVGCDCRTESKDKGVTIDGGQNDYIKVSQGKNSVSKIVRVEISQNNEEVIDDWKLNKNNLGFIYNLNINKVILQNLNGITKDNLKHLKHYVGICRNSTVAQWNEKEDKFIYLRYKMGKYMVDEINHPEDDDGFDLFIPLKELESPYDLVSENFKYKTSSQIFPKHIGD